MAKLILGKKIGMTRRFAENKAVPLTVVLAEPNVVIESKKDKRDGRCSFKIGAGNKKTKKLKKPEIGMFKGTDCAPQIIKEYTVDNIDEYKKGDKIEVSTFTTGDKVNVTGTTKGKGYSGVIKRHGFHRGPETHGSDHHRAPGSIGGGYPQRVVKGKKMPGQLGSKTTVQKSAEIFDIIPKDNIILIKGSIPGANNSWVQIKS